MPSPNSTGGQASTAAETLEPPAPLVELVLNVLSGSYAMEIIAGVEKAVRPHGLGVVVADLEGAETPGTGWMKRTLAHRPAGIITVFCSPSAEQRAQLRARDIPFVVIDPVVEPTDAPSVTAANWSGGLAAGRHLIELGHRRIGVVDGPRATLAARERLDGFHAALDEAGIAWDPALVHIGPFRADTGAAGARQLLACPRRPTAVFACSEELTVGVYRTAGELGLRIPDELSVVGYDDTSLSSWLFPALTTVRQPLAEMAAEAAALTLAPARGEQPAATRAVLPTELVVRASTAPRRRIPA